MENKKFSFTKILSASLIWAGVVAVASGWVGFSVEEGGPSIAVKYVILAVAFFLVMAGPSFAKDKQLNHWIVRLVEGVVYGITIGVVMYCMGAYIPEGVETAVQGDVPSVFNQLVMFAAPLGGIWFLANGLGDTIKQKRKYKKSGNNTDVYAAEKHPKSF